MRNPELLWNMATMARACDVDTGTLLELVRLDALPMPLVLNHEPFWVAGRVRAWARTLGAASPAFATAALVGRLQGDTGRASA